MLKWAVAPEERRRRDPTFTKRRKLSSINGQLQHDRAPLQQHVSDPNTPVTPGFPTVRLENALESESDSKSLFYMSLDHLPLAIVKQYERMIQESEQAHCTELENAHNVAPKSSELDISIESTKMVDSGKNHNLISGIKEAIHRPLNVINHQARRMHILESTQRYSDVDSDSSSSSSESAQIRSQWKPTQEQLGGNSALLKKRISKRTPASPMFQRGAPLKEKMRSNRGRNDTLLLKSSHQEKVTTHDTTDPDFLGESTPCPTKSVKRLSLKRHELRKLEKLRLESEKLNRFLRKYYNDCLPKLSEEEVECSPEEKSVSMFLGQLAKSIVLWDKGIDLSDSTSTPSEVGVPLTLADITEEDSDLSWGEGGGKIGGKQNSIQIPHEKTLSSMASPAVYSDWNENQRKISFADQPLDNHSSSLSASTTEVMGGQKVSNKKTPRKAAARRVVVKRRTPKSSSSKSCGGEVEVRTVRNGNCVTLHVSEARNFHHSQSTATPSKSNQSWFLSLKISLLGNSEEIVGKVQTSCWVKVTKGQRRVAIDEDFPFEVTQSEGKVKVFISFWRRWASKSRKSTLLGWTRTQLEQNQSDTWLPLRRDKMQKTSQASKFQEKKRPGISRNLFNETQASMGAPRCSLATMDSGVEDCGSDQANGSSASHGSTQSQFLVTLRKEIGETGFGFSVIWSSPPRIGRVTEGMAAERAGLRKGDLIARVNDEEIGYLDRELIMEKMKAFDHFLELDVLRDVDEVDFDSGHHCCCCSAHVHHENTSFHGAAPNQRPKMSLQLNFLPPPPSLLKRPPPPLPYESSRNSRGETTFWKIEFKPDVGQGTLV